MNITADSDCLDHYVEFAGELADLARTVTLHYFRRAVTVERKADTTPVTIADRKTEQCLRRRVADRFPDHGVLGEEFGASGAADGPLWVIDPIDGTKSFATGKPTFSTLIALLIDHEPQVGIIDCPATGERWIGVRHRRTQFQAQAAHTSAVQTLADATLYATTVDMFDNRQLGAFDAVSRASRFRNFGADAYAYGLLASGFVDLVMEADMHIHDFLALIPVVQGAGGVISDWRGQPLALDSDGTVLAAANPALHRQALALIHESHRA